MDEQLKALTRLLKHCHYDVRESVQAAIDEHKANIGYIEPVLAGMKETYDKMQRMVPEMGQDVVFFSDETTVALIDFFIEEDRMCMNSDTLSEILRDGFKGYDNWNDMELLTHYMNYYDENSEPSIYDVRVKQECDDWITITLEQILLK